LRQASSALASFRAAVGGLALGVGGTGGRFPGPWKVALAGVTGSGAGLLKGP
jgi:hypothetical protein